tara:strand:+ start:819 stop:1037 length:219 start_codon:yes stop_codon:yes gene_type:complete
MGHHFGKTHNISDKNYCYFSDYLRLGHIKLLEQAKQPQPQPINYLYESLSALNAKETPHLRDLGAGKQTNPL